MKLVTTTGRAIDRLHLDYLGDRNEPLCNLYLSMLDKLGIEQDSFAISTGTLKGISS